MTTRAEIDLIALVERDLGPGRRYGRWMLFECPFHDDRHPSLGVTNGNNQRGPGWQCFAASCGMRGGPIDWLTEYREMSIQEAWKFINGKELNLRRADSKECNFRENICNPPGPEWQARALEMIQRAEDSLWNGRGGQDKLEWPGLDPETGKEISVSMTALEWLLDRGLTESTLRKWKIGYIPLTWQDAAQKWGLTLSSERVYIFQGILIPCSVGKNIWYLKTRLPQTKPRKYIQITGSKTALFMAQSIENHNSVVFCEGELDALLLWQEIGDLAGVVTLGGSANTLDAGTWGIFLLSTTRRFTAYDLDASGEKGSENLKWLNTMRLDVPKLKPYDKDITHFHQSGGDLRQWFLAETTQNVLVSSQEGL